jgi:hypothetical protein
MWAGPGGMSRFPRSRSKPRSPPRAPPTTLRGPLPNSPLPGLDPGITGGRGAGSLRCCSSPALPQGGWLVKRETVGRRGLGGWHHLRRIRSAWVTKSAGLAAAEAGFRFFWPRGSLSSCDEGDFAEAASADEIVGLASISSRTWTILSAGGIAGENGCTVARTFGTESKQKRSTTTGLTLVGQRQIDGER